MTSHRDRKRIDDTMTRINEAWLNGAFRDLERLLHPGAVIVLPGFSARVEGRDAVVGGFREFYDGASIEDFEEQPRDIDVVGDTAVITYLYTLVYTRGGEKLRSTGRDLWMLAREDDGDWLAVWRTVLDVNEQPAS